MHRKMHMPCGTRSPALCVITCTITGVASLPAAIIAAYQGVMTARTAVGMLLVYKDGSVAACTLYPTSMSVVPMRKASSAAELCNLIPARSTARPTTEGANAAILSAASASV